MMLQPRKDVLREQLVLAADEIIRLRGLHRDLLAQLLHSGDEYRRGYQDGRGLTLYRWWHRFAWWRK